MMIRLADWALGALLIVLLGGCEGEGRELIVDPPVLEDLSESATGGLVTALCGAIEIEGQIYLIHCRLDGSPAYLSPLQDSDRRILVKPHITVPGPLGSAQSVQSDVPSNATVFELFGQQFIMMNLPQELTNPPLAGTAEALIAEYGVIVKPHAASLPYAYHYDPATGILDVEFAATGELALPDPFAFDNMYETIVIIGETRTFVYQRVVGSVETVEAYLTTITGAQSTSLIGP